MGIGSSRASNRASSGRRRQPASNVRPSRIKPRRDPIRRGRRPHSTTTTIQPVVGPPIIPIRPHRPARPPFLLPPISFPFAMQAMLPPSPPSPLYNPYAPYGYQPMITPYPAIIPPSIPAVPPALSSPAIIPPASAVPPIYYPPTGGGAGFAGTGTGTGGWNGPIQVSPAYNIPTGMPVQTAIFRPISRNLYTDWTGGGVISPGFLGPPL